MFHANKMFLNYAITAFFLLVQSVTQIVHHTNRILLISTKEVISDDKMNIIEV